MQLGQEYTPQQIAEFERLTLGRRTALQAKDLGHEIAHPSYGWRERLGHSAGFMIAMGCTIAALFGIQVSMDSAQHTLTEPDYKISAERCGTPEELAQFKQAEDTWFKDPDQPGQCKPGEVAIPVTKPRQHFTDTAIREVTNNEKERFAQMSPTEQQWYLLSEKVTRDYKAWFMASAPAALWLMADFGLEFHENKTETDIKLAEAAAYRRRKKELERGADPRSAAS